MRAVFALLFAALVAGAFAAPDHQNVGKHLRQQRAWGQRRAVSSASSSSAASKASSAAAATGTFLTEVPDDVNKVVTVSNTAAASAKATQAAQGVTQSATGPIGFSNSAGFGASCDPNAGVGCATGLTCSGKVCKYLCSIDTTEPYCDSSFPCNEDLGYTCYKSRCRPPTGAIRVQNGDTCDQGSGNTRFCIPGKGICASGKCQSCTQH
ncbi:hypothetical protein JCM10213_005012 [Rhodosporidiobolus nylandii]